MTRLHHARNTPIRGTGARPGQCRLNLAEVQAHRDQWLAQPPSDARRAALRTIRSQLASIRNRVGETR